MLKYGVSKDVVLRALVDDGLVDASDDRLKAIQSTRVFDLMTSTGHGNSWRELCEGQHEPSGSPSLVERVVVAYGAGQVSLKVVADLMGRDETETLHALEQAGW